MLLDESDPAPFEILRGRADSPFVITIDHAGKRFPRALGTLGLDVIERERHIAWDLGTADLGRRLAKNFAAVTVLQTYSRLVVDCNRPLDSDTLFATRSEDTEIEGNRSLDDASQRARIDEVFWPYHRAIERELGLREARGQESVVILLHSFTPVFRGFVRPWHAGVLSGRDRRLSDAVLALLRDEPGLIVGDNEPYAVSDTSDYGAIVYGERPGRLHLELEIRQDLLLHEAGLAEWQARLERILPRALERARAGA